MAQAVKWLACEKSQAKFTDERAELWARVLGRYDPKLVKKSLVYLMLSPDPFPDLSKVLAMVRRYKSIEHVARGHTDDKPSLQMVEDAAQDLGLDI